MFLEAKLGISSKGKWISENHALLRCFKVGSPNLMCCKWKSFISGYGSVNNHNNFVLFYQEKKCQRHDYLNLEYHLIIFFLSQWGKIKLLYHWQFLEWALTIPGNKQLRYSILGCIPTVGKKTHPNLRMTVKAIIAAGQLPTSCMEIRTCLDLRVAGTAVPAARQLPCAEWDPSQSLRGWKSWMLPDCHVDIGMGQVMSGSHNSILVHFVTLA